MPRGDEGPRRAVGRVRARLAGAVVAMAALLPTACTGPEAGGGPSPTAAGSTGPDGVDAGATEGTAPALPVLGLQVVARDDGGSTRFEAPDRVYDGEVPLTFENEGAQPHQLLVLRPRPASSVAQVEAALGGPAPTSALAFADLVGGAGTLEGGERVEAVLPLEAGDYFLAALAAGPDGASEARKGLFRRLTVVPSVRPRPVDPTRDAGGTLRLTGGSVEAPRTLAGPTWFEVENDETDPVGLAVLELKEGSTPEDAASWLDRALTSIPAPDPPFRWLGGAGPLLPGTSARVHLEKGQGRFLLAPVRPGVTGLFLPSTQTDRATLLQSV